MDFKNTERIRQQRRELVFKFLVIGDYGVGKTAIARRYVEGRFSSNYKITIGSDFLVKKIHWDANTNVNLQLWDIAGHERFGYMTSVYYKYAIGCAIVFDVSRYSSYESVLKWLRDLREKVVLEDGRNLPVTLLANKWDIGECCVSDEAINKLCRDVGIRAWFKTSAKENYNIEEAMNSLIEGALAVLKPDEKPPQKPEKGILLHEDKRRRNSETKCCK